MRIAPAFALFACLLLAASGSASANPLVPGDPAAANRALSAGVVEAGAKRRAKRYYRRNDWTSRPYWRPYQYRYWKFYYPYGGPLF